MIIKGQYFYGYININISIGNMNRGITNYSKAYLKEQPELIDRLYVFKLENYTIRFSNCNF